MKRLLEPYRYFILSLVLLVADQLTKFYVNKMIPLHSIAWSFGGDFFRLIHVRNKGAAFSLGSGLPDWLRTAFLVVVPLLVLLIVAVAVVRSKDVTVGQRWCLAAIVGGGLGNQLDRIFRPEGVVDFLDFKFYGLFGLERWPTFNIADAALVVSSIFLAILLVVQDLKRKKPAELEK